MNFVRLFSNCIMVKGYNQSTICDLQKGKYILIPNLLYEILNFNQTNIITYEKLLKKYKEEADGIKKYVNYLIDQGWMFYTNTPENFTDFNIEFDYPAKITNSIIDIDEHSNHLSHINKITALGCKTFQIRFFNPIQIDKILKDLDSIHKNENIHNIEVVMPFYNAKTKNQIYDLFPKVTACVFYKAPYEKVVFDKKRVILSTFVKRELNENECGEVKKANFVTNIPMFTESVSHNNCLNRKLSVDRHGYIKNCPSINLSYGKIQDTDILKVLINRKFTSYWKIKKDDVKICKDCEFRYICSDCRAFTQDNELHGKPSKCNYDPYENVWQ